MKNFYVLLVAGLSAFLITSVKAQDIGRGFDAPVEAVCAPDNLEVILTKALEESPESLMRILEGNDLIEFWNNLKAAQLMLGEVDVDKLYIIKSEHHAEAVYLFFLKSGCIVDVKMTSKALIERSIQ